jgi:hypothetical protein
MRPAQKASEKARARMRAAHSNRELRERRRVDPLEYWTSERKRQQSQATIARRADPAVGAKIRINPAAEVADLAVKAREAAAHRAAMVKTETRAKISKSTRKAMSDPAVRQHIVDALAAARARPDRAARAAEGLRRAYEADHIAVELKALCEVWAAARPAARKEFVAQLFGPPFQGIADG